MSCIGLINSFFFKLQGLKMSFENKSTVFRRTTNVKLRLLFRKLQYNDLIFLLSFLTIHVGVISLLLKRVTRNNEK